MTTISEVNFRDIYHQICFIAINDNIKHIMNQADFLGAEKANGILAYTYIDYEAGLTFEILCWAVCKEDTLSAFDGNNTVSFKLRGSNVEDCNIVPLTGIECARYQDKIDMVNDVYKCPEGIKFTRGIKDIDSCRNANYPDDILVYLVSEKNQPEGCWVRCTDAKDNHIRGTLLNEPNQDFGVHCGTVIEFGVMKQGDNNICIASL